MSNVLLAKDEFTAAYFGYEPNGDGNDAATAREPNMAEATDENGRFLPYWFRDGQSLAIDTLVDMDSSLYYDGVKKRFESSREAKGFITEPYSYQGVMIVEQVAPIVINGQFKGIAGVDRALGYIDELLSQLKQEAGNDFMLFSRNNSFISSTVTGNLQTKKLTDTPYNTLLTSLLNQAQKNSVVELIESEDPVSGADNFYAAASIPLGDWKLVQIISVDQVMAPLYLNVLRTLGLFLLAVVADEVRTLAARTQKSTEEIRTLISQLGDDVIRSVELVNSGVERANTSTETAENANHALSSVVEQINEVSGSMIQVAAAVQEQEATSAEVSRNMTNIHDAAEELSRMAIK